MASIRAEISIAVPPERVWRAVHEDLEETRRWAGYIRRATLLDGDVPGPNRRVRYELDLPGDIQLVLLPQTWDRPKRCAGKFDGGPVEGTWSYTYRPEGEGTHLLYDMDYRMGGLLRFAGGLLQSRYEDGIRQGMVRLKGYLESPTRP